MLRSGTSAQNVTSPVSSPLAFWATAKRPSSSVWIASTSSLGPPAGPCPAATARIRPPTASISSNTCRCSQLARAVVAVSRCSASASRCCHVGRSAGSRNAAHVSNTAEANAANRPSNATPLPSSPSTGSTPPNSRPSSSGIATPSNSRSRPNCQVFCASSCCRSRWRWSASMPQRTPASRTQRWICGTSSGFSSKRRRTGSSSSSSSTSDAVARDRARVSTRNSASATALSRRNVRSATDTRSCGAPSSRPPAANTASTSGANVSMSGLITTMSRGCSVGSASSSPSSSSRSTSTCRTGLWHTWMRSESSPSGSATGGQASRPGATRRPRCRRCSTSDCSTRSNVACPASMSCCGAGSTNAVSWSCTSSSLPS